MLNLQPATEKYFNFFHADIEAGRLPVRSTLPATEKDSMSTKAPTAFEMVPRRLELNSEMVVMESPLHSTPYPQAHGSDFEQFWPLPTQFGPPAPSQNFPHAAH